MSRYILRHLARSLSARPASTFLTFLACALAVTQLALTLHTVATVRTASLVPVSATTMMVYLKDKPDAAGRARLQQTIAALGGVARVEFIPCTQGLERMRAWLGPDNPLVADLDPEVLPDAFAVTLKTESVNQAAAIAARLTGLPGVEDVRYNRGLMGHLAGSYAHIRVVGLLFAGLLSLTFGTLIFLSLRLSISARTHEIQTLSLLGADRVFVYGPYVVEAVLIGLAGGVLGCIAAADLVDALRTQVTILQGILGPLTLKEAVAVTTGASLFSLGGAVMAIRR